MHCAHIHGALLLIKKDKKSKNASVCKCLHCGVPVYSLRHSQINLALQVAVGPLRPRDDGGAVSRSNSVWIESYRAGVTFTFHSTQSRKANSEAFMLFSVRCLTPMECRGCTLCKWPITFEISEFASGKSSTT